MSKNLKNVFLVILCYVILFSIISISSNAEAVVINKGGTMVVGISSDPGTLNGAISGSFFDKVVASNIFSMLIRLNKEMEPVGDLATEWHLSEDGLSYTFKLQKEAKWHDGVPVTAEDVKFTVEDVILKLHPRSGTYSQFISGVETIDPYTLVFKLKKPFGAFINGLGYDFFILPKHVYHGEDVKRHESNFKPIGSGPFKFKEWQRGSHIVLEKNEAYFKKDLPYLDRLVFRIIPDASSRIMALEAGDIDYLAYLALPSSAVPMLKKNKNITISQQGLESLASILMANLNLDRDILKNANVRRAIAHAINRQYIVDYADYGLGRPATGPISSLTNWAYEPDVQKYEYNPKLAEKILDEEGYKRGQDGIRFSLNLIADTGVELNRKASEIIREQLRSIGIKIDLQLLERGVMLDRVYVKRDYDMHIHGFSTGSDPAIDVARLYVSTNIRPVSFTNASGYRNLEVDELFKKGEETMDRKKRALFYREVQKKLVSDLPVIHLIEYGTVAAWNKKLQGLHDWSAYSYYIFWEAWQK